jgi:hypothetical protein
MSALTAENEGDLSAARATWTALDGQYANDPNESKAMWGWVAHKKLADLNAKDAWLADVARRIDKDFRAEDKDVRFGDDLTDQVATAIRFEQFRDFARAHDRWTQIATNLEGNKDRRADFVMARGKVRDLDGRKDQPKDPAERAKLIAERLSAVKALPADAVPADHQRTRNVLREIRDLYQGEKDEVGKLVDEANRLLSKAP